MPWGEVVLTQGANVELTPAQVQAGYINTQNGRFKTGMFQKLGGWQQFVPAAFSGIPRSLWAWQDLNNAKRLSVATTQSVTAVLSGQFTDLTPQRFTSDFTPDFTTTSGSADVEVVDPNIAGVTTDITVEFKTPISVGGLILSGTYPIKQVTGSNSYIIEAWVEATATVANGGDVPSFTTTSGSPNVTVTLNDHAQQDGFLDVFALPTAVGGVTVSGRYVVTDISNANQYTIVVDDIATSSTTVAMNGDDAQIIYHIAQGPQPSGFGYGIGFYGEGDYGLGSASTGMSGSPITATDWTQGNWGEILLACPENGPVYYWQPGSGYRNLFAIPEGPFFNKGMFVSMAAQQIVAYGSTVDARLGGGIGIYQDPLLVRWSDAGNFFVWEQLPDNFSREQRLPTGSLCVGGAGGKNRNLIWTDIDVYAMTFNGGPSVYTINQLGSNCGLVGLHAWAQQAETTYWMSGNNFYQYAGAGVQVMPCSVWDAVFQRLDRANQHRVVAGSNGDHTEIWWWFPINGGNGEVGAQVKYNTIDGTWDFDGPVRCAWLDRSILGNPLGATTDGNVYAHEQGYDDDNNPLVAGFTTGEFTMAGGQEFVFVDEVWPDFKWGEFGGSETAQIQITLLCRDSAGGPQRTYGPFVVGKTTPFFTPEDIEGTRPRCRFMSVKVESIDTGSFWRLGLIKYRYAPDGRWA